MASSSSPVPDASGADKRVSSRVRRQPEMFTSSPHASGKRKRDGEAPDEEDAEMPDEDEHEDDEDDDPEDDEPAEEEVRDQAKKAKKQKSGAPKKPAAKKPKVNGMSLPIRAGKAPPKKRAPKKTKAIDSADAEAAGGLYADLFARDQPADGIASDWIKGFQAHESRALGDLINFALKCAGCNSKLTEHDMEDPDAATARISDLQDEYQASNPTDYPLIAKGRSVTSFRSSMCGFIQTLVKALAASDILWLGKGELIENIHVWLSVLTSATNRAFRHTATTLSLSIITAFCEIGRDFAKKATDSRRLAETERRRPKVNKERVKQIELKETQCKERVEFVQGQIRDWFDTVFIHRYRDIDAAIRRDCVTALGDWTVIMPETFLDGAHLRYMGWLLSDASFVTRLEDLKQLRRLYSDADKIVGLRAFTERFRERLVEIATSDSEPSVRVAGIELLDLLRENGLLEPDDIDAAGRLVFHDDARIRKAIAAFFSESVNELYISKIDELGGTEALEEALPEISDDNFEAPRIEWLRFKSLAEMLSSYDHEDVSLPNEIERSMADGSLSLHAAGVDSRFTLAVDALYDKIPYLKEWQSLAGYVLFDHSSNRTNGAGDDPLAPLKGECTLTEKEEIILLEVLTASVKRSLNTLGEKMLAPKSKPTKRQKEEIQEEQEEEVRHLTEILPKLLKKYGDVPVTAASVLRLEGVLSMPSLQSLRQDTATNVALMDDLSRQFMSHGTDDVLAPATSAILHAQSYGDLDETASDKLSSLWDDVVGNLAELLDVSTLTVRGTAQNEELLALSNNLLRIVRLSMISDCTAPLEDDSIAANDESTGKSYHGAIDFILDLIQRALPASGPALDAEDAALENEIAARAAEAGLLYIRWKLVSIMTTITTGTSTGVAYEILEPLAERRDALANNLIQILESRKAADHVTTSLCSSLLDLFTSAAVLRTVKAKPGVSDDYTALIMDFDESHEKMVTKIFAATEKEFAKLAGKKLGDGASSELVNDDDDPVDEDPLSDSESEADEPQTQTQASQQRQHAKKLQPLVAEQRLCMLTSKIIYAISAGVIDAKAMRKRLERNKTKLGANYKEVLAYLDAPGAAKKQLNGKGKAKAKGPTKATANGGAKKKKAAPKSNAIVAEDELDDEIEDFDDDGDDTALKRRELDVDGDADREPEEDEDMGVGAQAEEESVVSG